MTEKRTYSSPLRQQQTEDTRRRILEVAIDLMSENPHGNITHEEVATRSSIALRTVYRHFPSRTDLLDAVWQASDQKLGPTEYPETEEALLAAVEPFTTKWTKTLGSSEHYLTPMRVVRCGGGTMNGEGRVSRRHWKTQLATCRRKKRRESSEYSKFFSADGPGRCYAIAHTSTKVTRHAQSPGPCTVSWIRFTESKSGSVRLKNPLLPMAQKRKQGRIDTTKIISSIRTACRGAG